MKQLWLSESRTERGKRVSWKSSKTTMPRGEIGPNSGRRGRGGFLVRLDPDQSSPANPGTARLRDAGVSPSQVRSHTFFATKAIRPTHPERRGRRAWPSIAPVTD